MSTVKKSKEEVSRQFGQAKDTLCGYISKYSPVACSATDVRSMLETAEQSDNVSNKTFQALVKKQAEKVVWFLVVGRLLSDFLRCSDEAFQ